MECGGKVEGKLTVLGLGAESTELGLNGIGSDVQYRCYIGAESME